MSAPHPSDAADAILVPRARLAEVKAEIDQLRAERERLAADRDRLSAELSALTEEHRNLRDHLTGSIREVARLTDEVVRLRQG